MKQDQRFSLRSNVILRASDDCALLVDLSEETIYSANGTGANVLQLIAAGLSITEMLEHLAQEYHPTQEQLEADVRGLLESLLDRGLIEEKSVA